MTLCRSESNSVKEIISRTAGPLRLGAAVGLLFGLGNLLYSWLSPLADDTVSALLGFYGPMFFIWATAGFFAARGSGRVITGVTTGALVALATFCVYSLLVLLRVNVLLHELTGRADWQHLMARFDASGDGSLRTFVNVENVKGAPLKIGVASAIGALMGAVGGALGRLALRRR